MRALPPVWEILLADDAINAATPRELDSVLNRGLAAELERQAEWTESGFDYSTAQPSSASSFAVTPVGSFNPFSALSSCKHPMCRQHEIDKFVRAVGLYSDGAALPDILSHYFAHHGVTKTRDSSEVFRFVTILREIEPLLTAGILTIGSPPGSVLNWSNDEAIAALSPCAANIIDGVRIDFQARGDLIFAVLPDIRDAAGHEVEWDLLLRKEDANNARLALNGDWLEAHAVHEVVYERVAMKLMSQVGTLVNEVAFSGDIGTVPIGGSALESLYLASLSVAPVSANVVNAPGYVDIDLPWVSKLSAKDIIRLREQAASALPALRRMLSERLKEQTSDNLPSLAEDLRAQAAEVEAELSLIKRGRTRLYKAAIESLALSLVLYGATAPNPAILGAAVAAFLASLVHTENVERDSQRRRAEVMGRPGYVLVKAKEFLGGKRATT